MTFHRSWGLAVLCLLVVVLIGCGGSKTPTAPSPPPKAACETNNTAQIRFENRSASNLTYSIVWDGSNLLTLAPGQASEYQTVAAGVNHMLQFKITNSGWLACSTSYPTLAQCSTHTYSCSY